MSGKNTAPLKYVGITGSAGKTTTKEFIYQILSHKYRCFRSPQNWNNWIGLPFSLLQMSGREEAAVFELAMSDPGIGEIDRLAEILKPDVAVLLNVFPVHLEFLKIPGQRRPGQGRDPRPPGRRRLRLCQRRRSRCCAGSPPAARAS